MANVLVTGVNGFVGHHVARELNAQGWSVYGLGRDVSVSHELESFIVEYYECDLANKDEASKLPLEKVSAVINLAGLAEVGASFENPDLYMQVNTDVLRSVCDLVVSRNIREIRILAISSGAVYDNNQTMPLTEESAVSDKSSPYAASKIAMEQLAAKYREQGLDCIIARPFNHIGPGQLEGFLLPDLYKKLVESQAQNKPLLVGNLSTKRDYTDVRDVAKAYVDLITEPSLNNSTYNVCSGTPIAGEEILALLQEIMKASNINTETDKSLFRPSDAPILYGDNSKIKRDLAWQPAISVKESVADFVKSKT